MKYKIGQIVCNGPQCAAGIILGIVNDNVFFKLKILNSEGCCYYTDDIYTLTLNGWHTLCPLKINSFLE